MILVYNALNNYYTREPRKVQEGAYGKAQHPHATAGLQIQRQPREALFDTLNNGDCQSAAGVLE
jgi:hypothetical protein